jgi:DNA-binding transcriptional MerR regulator
MRPIDLARVHGLSSQAIRSYEERGILPPADRTSGGHRSYGERHRLALAAFRALAPSLGHAASAELVTLAHQGQIDGVLEQIDRGHAELADDRAALDRVARVVDGENLRPVLDLHHTRPLSIGQVARRIGVTAATLRTWETAGILRPTRDPRTGHRLFHADDLRDALLARQLRRGRHPLELIADIVAEVHEHRSHDRLVHALHEWRATLRARGLGLLAGAAALHELINHSPPAAGSTGTP